MKVDTLEKEKIEFEKKYNEIQKYNETLGKIMNEKYEKELSKKIKELNDQFNRTLKEVKDSFNTRLEEMKKLIIYNRKEGNKINIQDNINFINSMNRNINIDSLNKMNFNNNIGATNNNYNNNINNIRNEIYNNSINKEGENNYSNNSFNTKPLNHMKNYTYNNNSNNNNNNLNIINPHTYNINNNIYQIYYSIMPILSNNKQNKNKIDINENYSFECINTNSLHTTINEGENQAKIDLKLKNTGPKPWLEGNAKLIFEYSNFENNKDIMLETQKKGEEKTYRVPFQNLEEYQEGDYQSDLRLNINGQNVGKPIGLIVSIKENNDELMKNKKIVQNFKNEYDLIDYSEENY